MNPMMGLNPEQMAAMNMQFPGMMAPGMMGLPGMMGMGLGLDPNTGELKVSTDDV